VATLLISEQEDPHFHFTLRPTNCATSLDYNYVYKYTFLILQIPESKGYISFTFIILFENIHLNYSEN
jgi:hypothetical protein